MWQDAPTSASKLGGKVGPAYSCPPRQGGGFGGGLYGAGESWGEAGCIHAPPPFLAAPPKFLMELHHFSISLKDFSFFCEIVFVPQAQVELFVFTIEIFILRKFDDNKNKARKC
jgi:hypothetical protein